MEKEIEISFIIVNYRSADNIKKCVSSIRDKVRVPFEIIIVNNDSPEINDSFFDTEVKIINSGKNIGFGSAINRGRKEATGKILGVLNPDLVFISENVDIIPTQFRKNRSIGVIGPKLYDDRNKEQRWSAGVRPTISDLIRNNLGIYKSERIWNSKKEMEADWVSGASLFIRKDLFDKLSGFDEKFFLYYEDVDLCVRVKKLGFQIIYMPQVKIMHSGGKSFKKKDDQKKHFYASQKYYFRKHYGKIKSGIVDLLRRLTH